MVRASILVSDPSELWQAYEIIDLNIPNTQINIIGIENRLMSSSLDSNVILNVAYNDTLIGEIELNMAAKAVDFYGNKFLSNLCKAPDVRKLK